MWEYKEVSVFFGDEPTVEGGGLDLAAYDAAGWELVTAEWADSFRQSEYPPYEQTACRILSGAIFRRPKKEQT